MIAEELVEYFRRTFILTDAGELLWRSPGPRRRANTRAGSHDKINNYWIIKRGNACYKAHTVIWAILYGEIPHQIDHINGNPLDNRPANLRVCTQAENTFNRGKNKKGSSKYKGVGWHKKAGKWAAQIQANGIKHHLGVFETEAEAAIAYNQAATQLHGCFARLNEV